MSLGFAQNDTSNSSSQLPPKLVFASLLLELGRHAQVDAWQQRRADCQTRCLMWPPAWVL